MVPPDGRARGASASARRRSHLLGTDGAILLRTLIGDARRVLAESRSSPDLARPVGGTWHRLLAGARPCGDATFDIYSENDKHSW